MYQSYPEICKMMYDCYNSSMPEGPLQLKDVPGVTDLEHEENMLPHTISEQAGQALDKVVKPEELQGKDWATTVKAQQPVQNPGFEKSDFKPTTVTPESYTTNHPGWWTRLTRGWALSKEKGGYWFNARLKEVGRRGQTTKNGSN